MNRPVWLQQIGRWSHCQARWSRRVTAGLSTPISIAAVGLSWRKTFPYVDRWIRSRPHGAIMRLRCWSGPTSVGGIERATTGDVPAGRRWGGL